MGWPAALLLLFVSLGDGCSPASSEAVPRDDQSEPRRAEAVAAEAAPATDRVPRGATPARPAVGRPVTDTAEGYGRGLTVAAEPDSEEQPGASGPLDAQDDSGGVLRRAISESWVLDHTATYQRGGPSGILAELRTALQLAAPLRRPGDVEVPVDTDLDGRPNAWVYFAGERPAWVEGDRFGTGCHDLRVTLATGEIAERYGWETSPPVPLTIDVPATPLGDVFAEAAAQRGAAERSTRFAELAGRHFAGLADALPDLAEQRPIDRETLGRIAEFAARASKLQPLFQRVHQQRDFARQLRRPWGHQETHEGFDLNGDGKEHREVLAGFGPAGVVRIQFYERDWREAGGFLAGVEFDGPAIESVQYQDRRYYRLGDFWVRPAAEIRRTLAERYLAPGYRRWQLQNWYAAVRLWQHGTELAALLGDLPIDGEGRPRAEPAKWVRGTEFAEARRDWDFEVDGLPAAVLLSTAANLAWMRDAELTDELHRLAEDATGRREYFEALARYRLLLRFARKLDRCTTQANALDAMSEIYRHLGNYDLALDCLNESVALESSLAYARDIMENVQLLAADADDPQELRKAMELRSHAMTLNRGCKLGTMAALHAELGNREQAEGYLAEARRLIQSTGARYCEADLLNLEAGWDIADGRWGLAQQRLERAMHVIAAERAVQQQEDRGRKLLDAGQARHQFLVPGERTYLQVGMRAQTGPDSFRALSAGLMAEAWLQQALDSDVGAGPGQAWLADARRWQTQAIQWYAAGRDAAGQLTARLHLARILAHQEDYAAARELNGQVIAEARRFQAFETIWQSLALEGLIHSRQGDWEAAVAAYEEAAREVEMVRAGLGSEAVRRGFFQSKLEVYEQLAALYERRRDGQPAAEQRRLERKIWECMERAKARTLLDMVAGQPLLVRGAAVRDAFRDNPLLVSQLHGGGDARLGGDWSARRTHEELLQQLARQPGLQELASLATVQPVALASVQRELPAGSAMLEYFVTAEALLAAVILPDRLAVHRVAGYGREQLQRDVAHYRRVLEQVEPDFAAPARNLYQHLLQPLLAELSAIRHLCIVPAGPLHYLPFEALLLPSGEFVAERYQVSYTPSASALVYALHRRPPGRSAGDSRTLVVAGPEPRLDYGDLPGALLEGERVCQLTPGSQALLQGREATETSVLAALPSSRYFHFAGHTDLPPGGPLRAALLCTPDVDRDGRLEVREIFELDLQACELAVLSACETRLGAWSRGDELVGLERAFLRAGVPSVVASLWKVDDAATAVLMEEFYTNLWQKSLPRAVALSQARQAVLGNPERLARRRKELAAELAQRGRRGPLSPAARPFTEPAASPSKPAPARAHPGYWAAFVLTGDWR